MQSEKIKDLLVDAIDDLKGQEIRAIFVGDVTSVTDWMVVASGTSGRHVASIAEHVKTELKQSGCSALGIEGLESGEWVLVDFGSVVAHIMQPETRRFYDLESLWGVKPGRSSLIDADN